MPSKLVKVARYSALGLEFSSPILGGIIVGHLLDVYFKTDPIFTVIMLILGFAAGVTRLIMVARNFSSGDTA